MNFPLFSDNLKYISHFTKMDYDKILTCENCVILKNGTKQIEEGFNK